MNVEKIKVLDRSHLEFVLRGHLIPYKLWGKGFARNVDQLYEEIRQGKSRLEVHEHKLARVLHESIVQAYIPIYKDIWHRLLKHHRVLPNGKTEKFRRQMGLSTSILRRETEWNAARRVIRDVLEVTVVPQLHDLTPKDIDPLTRMTRQKPQPEFDSLQYPGLLSLFYRYEFACLLPPNWITKTHHRHTEPDKTIVTFLLRPVKKEEVPPDIRQNGH